MTDLERLATEQEAKYRAAGWVWVADGPDDGHWEPGPDADPDTAPGGFTDEF